jgi:hypothetical protein
MYPSLAKSPPDQKRFAPRRSYGAARAPHAVDTPTYPSPAPIAARSQPPGWRPREEPPLCTVIAMCWLSVNDALEWAIWACTDAATHLRPWRRRCGRWVASLGPVVLGVGRVGASVG